jgi:hypothetical protein
VTDLIERLRSPGPCSSPHHGSLHREAAEELERLRQRELDLLEERRMLRAEVVKAKVKAETWAECVAELRADRERHLQDAEKILDSFDSGLFIRDISRDHESGWAMRYLKPMAAISRLRAAIDAARKKEA